jgi:hypothetical protein
MKNVTKTDWQDHLLHESYVGEEITLSTPSPYCNLDCRLRMKDVGEKIAIEIWVDNGAVTRLNHLFDSEQSAIKVLEAIERKGKVDLTKWTQQPKESCFEEWEWNTYVAVPQGE